MASINKILFFVLGVPALLVALFFLACFLVYAYAGSGYGRHIHDDIEPLELKAIVVNKFEESPCFGSIIIKQNNKIDTLHDIYSCTDSSEAIWEYVLPGDSLYKGIDSLKVNIIRNGKKSDFVFPTHNAG